MAEARPRSAGWGLPSGGAAALLVLLAAPAWGSSFRGAFQFDDWNVIVEEPRVASLAAWWGAMPGIRPLTKLTFAVDHALGLGLPGFHATNLLLHLLAALLALALLTGLERALGPGGPPPGRAPAAALLGALLFALHPIQTEAVTYLSGRAAPLAALLALASLLAWQRGRVEGRPWLTRGASPLLFAAALGAKESAAALPVALLLLAALDPPSPGRWRRALADASVHLAVLAAAALAFLAAPAYRVMLARALGARTPLLNLKVHLAGLAWLAGQVARPDLLLADPGLAEAGGPWWPAALAAVAVAGVLLLGLAALLAGPRAPLGLGATPGRRAAALALLWWLCWLPPSGWLLPRPEAANDRQAYLAILGPAWLVGRTLAAGLAAAGARRALAWLATAALLAGLGVATWRRSLIYVDEVTFWADAAGKAPGNPRALNNLGLALSAACRLEEAAAAFEAALALDPGHARARVNLWLLRQGEPPGERRGHAAVCPAPGQVSPGPGN